VNWEVNEAAIRWLVDKSMRRRIGRSYKERSLGSSPIWRACILVLDGLLLDKDSQFGPRVK
jgi:hypothetical protein